MNIESRLDPYMNPDGTIRKSHSEEEWRDQSKKDWAEQEERKLEARRYIKFLRKYGRLSNVSHMRRALTENFPGRFGPGKWQDAYEIPPREVVGAYNGILRYARELKQRRR